MNFLERLDKLKAARGDNNATLSKKSGIPYSTIDGLYKKGYENMKLSTLEALCEYFGVTLDYLAKGVSEKPADVGELSYNEERFVFLYRQLGEEGQHLIEAYLSLSPSSRRLLSGFVELLLQNQEPPPVPHE